MKTMLLILSLLSSPAAVMSGPTSLPDLPKSAPPSSLVSLPEELVGNDASLSNPFEFLSKPESLLSSTAALVNDQESVDCLARTVYFEARGEPVAGQMAVASVVLARVESEEFPDTVCEVVTEARKPGKFRCQFTWWCDGRTDVPKNAEEYRRAIGVAVAAMLLGPQPDGPTHFHAADMQPQWDMDQVATIGGHVFYN